MVNICIEIKKILFMYIVRTFYQYWNINGKKFKKYKQEKHRNSGSFLIVLFISIESNDVLPKQFNL